MKKIISIFSLALFITGCAVGGGQKWVSGSKIEVDPEIINQAKNILINSLKDPNSAILPIEPYALKYPNGSVIVCGEVNAKNSFGGYTGAKIFYVNMQNSHTFIFNQNDRSSHTYIDLNIARDCALNKRK